MKEENNKLVSNPTRRLEFSLSEVRNLENENKSDPWGFEKLYNKYGLINNALFFRNELERLLLLLSSIYGGQCKQFCELKDIKCLASKKAIFNKMKELVGRYSTSELIVKEFFNYLVTRQHRRFNIRNFLAHCGFEDNITEMCKDKLDEGKYYLSYLNFKNL